MSTPLRILNLALGGAACLLAAGLGREAVTAYPLPPPPALHAPRPVTAAAVAAVSTTLPPAPAYGGIVAKNLFNASRTEAPVGPVVAAGPKPLLHGVVMDGPKSRAYLEDPLLKRTFSYGIGDTVGGGRVESIAADRVMIGRGDGLVEVLLRDPSKPRPTPTAATSPAATPSAATAAAATGAQAGPVPATPATSTPTVPTAAAGPPAPAAQNDRR
jgi:hypothetical protein